MSDFLGIFVNLPHVQTEGIDPVLDNLARCGVEALCITPKFGVPTPDGVRFPPLHVDGVQRVFARPVWGHSEVKTAFHLTYIPDKSLYVSGNYAPSAPTLTDHPDFDLPDRLIVAAHERRMTVHMLLQPLVVPGLRAEDAPLRVDGSRAAGKVVSPIGCPNNPHVRAYALACVRDVVRRYPALDGLFIDWAEYGAYHIEDFFTCCCEWCAQAARAAGLEWDAMQRDSRAFWDYLHNLDTAEVRRAGQSSFLELGAQFPGWLVLQGFKARTITSLYTAVRSLLDDNNAGQIALSARGWCAPWNTISGMDYGQLAALRGALTPKLFLFDYVAIPRWYGETLLAWNPALAETDVIDAVLNWFDLPDARPSRTLDQYMIPPPDEPHPFDFAAYERRIAAVVAAAAGAVPVYPFAHAYLPLHQWRDMLTRISASGAGGMWVQSYGYMSDAALDILAER